MWSRTVNTAEALLDRRPTADRRQNQSRTLGRQWHPVSAFLLCSVNVCAIARHAV
jgi:hypothetical protein